MRLPRTEEWARDLRDPGFWSRLPSDARRQWPQRTTPCPAWASSRDPRPRTVPWLSPNPLMSSVKTPGSLSMRHHSPALPVMAPATHRPAPPQALAAPRTSCSQPLISANPPLSSSTPRHPAYFPTASGRRHLQRDRAREDALAIQETAKLFLGRAGPVADSEGAGA